jgi:hypothetical protein
MFKKFWKNSGNELFKKCQRDAVNYIQMNICEKEAPRNVCGAVK